MSTGFDPLTELVLPADTEVQERDLVTEGDVFIGGQSTIDFGVRGRNVVAGERVRFDGDIEASGDCRLDIWCEVSGNVLVGENAYLGERVHIDGRLVVSGDLDIGDDVQIAEGFEANGWIVIRNPMPTIVFLFIYLGQLLRLGEEEAAEAVMDEFLDEEVDDATPLCIPRGAELTDSRWQVGTPARIGARCRLHGNLRASSIEVDEECDIFGSLRSREDIQIEEQSRVHGDVTTRSGNVTLGEAVEVLGDVACVDLTLGKRASVAGSIRASGEVRMVGPAREPEP